MKYLRYLLYALAQLGVIGGGVWLYSILRHIPILQLDLLSGGFLTFVVLSFIPLIQMIAKERKSPFPNIPNIKSKSFPLRTEYRTTTRRSAIELKEVIRDICNRMILSDRVLAMTAETDNSLEYVTQPRQDEIGIRKRRRPVEQTRITIEIDETGQPNSAQLFLCSASERREIGIDNFVNRENLAAIVQELNHAGFGQQAKLSPRTSRMHHPVTDAAPKEEQHERFLDDEDHR